MTMRPDGDLQSVAEAAPAAPGIRRGTVAVVGAGLLADLAVRAGTASLAMTLLIAFAAVTTACSGLVRRRQATGALLAAIAVASWLTVRSSPWLVVPDVIVAASLLVLGAALTGGGNVFDLDAPGWLRRAARAFGRLLIGPVVVLRNGMWLLRARGQARARSRVRPFLRGVTVALPVAAVLGALLRSADPVFASFVDLHFNGRILLGHPALMAVGASMMAGLFQVATAQPTSTRRPGSGGRRGPSASC